MNPIPTNDFAKLAAEDNNRGLIGEIWAFLRQNKKWWLLPIVLVLVIFGIFMLLSSTAAAPFIYTLF